MAKIKVSELAQLNADRVNEETSLLAVDSLQSYQLRYGFLSANLSSNLYRPLTETVSAECKIQQQKDDILSLALSCSSLSNEIGLSVSTLTNSIGKKLDNDISATVDSFGLVRLGYSLAGNNYPLKLDNDGKAYVTVTGGGGGGGDDRVDELASISSYYASSDGSGNITNKVSVINDELISKTNKLNNAISQLCIDVITGEEGNDPKSLSINFDTFRKTVANISVDESQSESDDIELTGGILYQLISADAFTINNKSIAANSEAILSSANCFKAGYLAIGIQISTYSPNLQIVLEDRYIHNTTNDQAYVCVKVKNNNSTSKSVTISGIITYLHTSKVYAITDD